MSFIFKGITHFYILGSINQIKKRQSCQQQEEYKR